MADLSPHPPTQPAAPAPRGVRRRWLYAVLILAFLFVLMPFLFWQATWFGRPLDDAQMRKLLGDREHPRNAQHALSQIADRILSPDAAARASARQWYPDVVRLSSAEQDELRLTAAWVMGQDNTVPEFHQALLRLIDDPHPMVRRNAALALVRFGDASGRPIILGMLEPCAMQAARAGTLLERLKPGDVINPGTLLGSIVDGKEKTEIRSQVPGTVDRWLVPAGASVAVGQPLVLLDPSPEMVWEALRALYLIGRPEDLPAVERFARAGGDISPNILQQAENTARAIQSRSHP